MQLQARLESHQKASDLYLDAGVSLLRLAQKAYSLWSAQPQSEKRKLLDILLLNCTFDGENLRPEYRKPLCWLAEGHPSSIWRG